MKYFHWVQSSVLDDTKNVKNKFLLFQKFTTILYLYGGWNDKNS